MMIDLDEREYLKLADATIRRIEAAFDDIDPDSVECERAGDVVTILFKNGKRAVLNTQRPTRQIWFAANARGWHFRYDGSKWVDDKDANVELLATIAQVVRDGSGVSLRFR